MSAATAAQIVTRLAVAGPPGIDSFAALLATSLRPNAENADWTFYSFEWPDGPFAGGLLRVSSAGDAALLSLSPRDPPGLTEVDLDSAAWGPRRDAVPMPRVSPEGADLLSYRLHDVIVSTLWTHTLRRLVNLTLEWPASDSPINEGDPA